MRSMQFSYKFKGKFHSSPKHKETCSENEIRQKNPYKLKNEPKMNQNEPKRFIEKSMNQNEPNWFIDEPKKNESDNQIKIVSIVIKNLKLAP